MTDRANRGSNICGIATKSWPASDVIAPSDRPIIASHPVEDPQSIHGFRCAFVHKKYTAAANLVGFAARSTLCYRSARWTPARPEMRAGAIGSQSCIASEEY